jgi:hypothetical protein
MAGPAAKANIIANATLRSIIFFIFTFMGLLLYAFMGGVGLSDGIAGVKAEIAER